MKKEMSGKVKIILLLVIITLFDLIIFNAINFEFEDTVNLEFIIQAEESKDIQVYYVSDQVDWTEKESKTLRYMGNNNREKLKFILPRNVSRIRLDVGETEGDIKIEEIALEKYKSKINIGEYLLKDFKNDIDDITINNQNVCIHSIGTDPYIIFDVTKVNIGNLLGNNKLNLAIKVLLCLIIDIMIVIGFKKIKSIFMILSEVNNNKELIWNLAKNDFKTKYAGSYLGITWAFVQPIVTVLIYWFVFQVGFKSVPVNDFPYVLWLVVGIVPWFFFNEALLNATNSMLEYSYLVKKVVFKISILPIVKIISSLFVHMFFIAFTIVLFLINGYNLNIHMIQAIYYTICTFALVLSISYTTCSIIIFFRDLGQIVGIFLQIGMWMTPIMWSFTMISENNQWILKINPMYYIVEGYRDSFINNVWFWNRYNQTVYFWLITIGLFAIGTAVFKRLKVHFADVL